MGEPALVRLGVVGRGARTGQRHGGGELVVAGGLDRVPRRPDGREPGPEGHGHGGGRGRDRDVDIAVGALGPARPAWRRDPRVSSPARARATTSWPGPARQPSARCWPRRGCEHRHGVGAQPVAGQSEVLRPDRQALAVVGPGLLDELAVGSGRGCSARRAVPSAGCAWAAAAIPGPRGPWPARRSPLLGGSSPDEEAVRRGRVGEEEVGIHPGRGRPARRLGGARGGGPVGEQG